MRFFARKRPLTVEHARAVLAKVRDPLVGKDLVSLNRLKQLSVEDGRVQATVLLTAPSRSVTREVGARLRALEGAARVDVRVELLVPADPRLQVRAPAGVKNAIAVASGKGGVGKSTAAVNLAVALAAMGASVGLMDGDLYGPNVPMMLGITGQPIAMGGKMVPLSAHGVRVMSIGMLVEPGTPVVWRGPMLDQAVKQFIGDVLWGALDYLVVDLPPGTGDVQISLCQALPLTGALIVTTPQAVALSDVVKGAAMFQQLDVPLLGIVENMSAFTCPDCGRRHELFGSGGGKQMAERFKVPLLAQLPFESLVRAGGDEGVPVVVRAPESQSGQAFFALAETVAAVITQRHINAPARSGPILAPELKIMN